MSEGISIKIRAAGRLRMARLAALLAATSALSPAFATAQEIDPATATETEAVTEGQLDAIVVTAQRREQKLQDVPVSVTAFDGAALEARGIDTVQDLAQVDPSLSVPQVVGVYLPFLRGIGNPAGGNLGNESSVPVYIDDMYYTRLSTAYLAINSVERVEVLKGPQGTLFGRNSSGGAIQIFTKDPRGDDAIDATIGYANYDRWTGQFYASKALGDTLGWNISLAGARQNRGWGHSLATGAEIFKERYATVRSKLLWEPTDATTIKLSGFYAFTKGDIGLVNDRHSGTFASTPTVEFPGYPQPPQKLPSLADVPGASFYDTRSNYGQFAREEGYGGTLRIDQDLGFANLVSISGYRRSEGTVRLDADITPQNLLNGDLNHTDRQFSQEFQLQSPRGSAINWIVGAYYLNSKVRYVPIVLYGDLLTLLVAPGGTQNVYSRQVIDSLSSFGQATVPLGEDTNVTAGLRYTSDKVTGNGRVTATVPGVVGEIPLGPEFNDSERFRRLTWKGSIDHHFSDDVMAYASISRGFKSGAYKTFPLNTAPARPEIIDAYEVGLKTELLDRRVRLNGAVFWNDIKNPQVLTVTTENGVPGINLTNADAARVKGAELGIEAAIGDGLRLRGAATYLDGKYRSYQNAPFYFQGPVSIVGPCTVGADGLPSASNPAGCGPLPADGASGNRLPNVSKWRWDVGANYTYDAEVGRLVADAGVSYTGRSAWNPDNYITEDPVTLVNASLRFTPAGRDEITIGVWGKNLTGEEYYSITQESVLAFDTAGFQSGAAAPRTYGVEVNFKL